MSTEPTQGVSWHLDAIRPLFRTEWPRVENPEDWYTQLYNAQDSLEYEWIDLAERIDVDGVDLVRDEVENWRVRYVCWVEDAEETLRGLLSSDPHYHGVETVHSRGARILEHVDAILGDSAPTCDL